MITSAFSLINEVLTAAIVVIAASMLLYNLSRNLRNRVARTSGAALACVTVAYIADVLISLEPGVSTYSALLRFQWLGIAFIPSALFHLSDALLATTGLPSRGRRRRAVRILYGVSLILFLLVAFTNLLVNPVTIDRAVSLRAGPLFPVYVLYFLSVNALALWNVNRARLRCLTRSTRRRMGYLQLALITPAIGVFPFSVLLGPGDEFTLQSLILVNIANLVVILMLVFLSYPLSFFGSRIPDRVVKAELLNFFLRGPATGLLALVVIQFTVPATRIIGIRGDQFMPFAVVAVVLLWQWTIAFAQPRLERNLIYRDEDDEQWTLLQTLTTRLLSRGDLIQLSDAVVRAVVDYFQVNTAFLVVFNANKPEIIAYTGPSRPTQDLLENAENPLLATLNRIDDRREGPVEPWHSYWVAPLRSHRLAGNDGKPRLIGALGVQARSLKVDLTEEDVVVFERYLLSASQTLDDIALQGEIYAALEGLLPQISITRASAAELEFAPGRDQPRIAQPSGPTGEQLFELVRAALRHYWGGPGLTSSRLLELSAVRASLEENGGNPAHAMRAVLQDAIDGQRPEGEPKASDPEWMLYNILKLRFIDRMKVRDVARRLAVSESDLYRKQKVAIQAVADSIAAMEQEKLGNTVKPTALKAQEITQNQ